MEKPKNKIHQQGWQHCYTCEKLRLHIPKMDAVKAGKRVCNTCSAENVY